MSENLFIMKFNQYSKIKKFRELENGEYVLKKEIKSFIEKQKYIRKIRERQIGKPSFFQMKIFSEGIYFGELSDLFDQFALK